jgi:hypothetical protein
MESKVGKNVSIYKGVKIYDKTILKMIGSETYCYLLRMEPDLYEDFSQFCERKKKVVDGMLFNSKADIEVNFVEAKLTNEDVKRGLMAMVYEKQKNTTEDVNQYIRDLKKSSINEHRDGEMSNLDTFIFIVFLIIIISLIVYSIYFFIYNTNKDVILDLL